MMDETKKNVLQKYRKKIVADLEVNDLLDDLFNKLVIDSDDRDKILSQKERTFRTRCLLDILLLKGNEEYDNFLNVLSAEYNWLANSLRQDIGCVSEIEYEEQIYTEALTSGDVPQLPMHYVPRSCELKLIQEKLRVLKRGQYLVLHGMTGSGKSVLAISAVRNPDVLKLNFHNCMYFVNAGEAKTELDIANLLYRLYIKLDNCNTKYMDTNIEFNYTGICYMKTQLQKYFSADFRRDALLVLDDVCSKRMVDSFSFGCKMLITTQDTSLVPQNSELLEINKGFKEHESLLLFSKCTKLNIEQLPIETKKIHDLCKGAPLVIALIASNLEKWKKDAQNKERWNYYVNMLIDKKDGRLAKAIQKFFRRKKEERSNDYLFNTIKHCVESLSNDYQEYYKHFALFVEDVNITPQVLEIVLKKSKYEIEDIVSEFMNKSLIVCAYNTKLKSYVYGIHDLLLAHLKQSLKKDELKKLHEKVVKNYLEISGNDFAKLPNDNYIFTYIGYHFVESKQFHYFPKIYFDLNFIGAKIKAVGIAGLVGDFVRYRDYIIKKNDSEDYSKKLDTFKSFVERCGQDILKYPDTDIVQCGLQQPLNSEVYEAALEIALKQCSKKLYLQTQFFGQTYYVTYTLDLNDEICATCFAHFTNIILVGTNSGEIHLWDHNYKSKLRTFRGHTKKIIHIQVSQDTKRFLSVSEDGLVKLWLFEDTCIESNGVIVENGFHSHTPQPAIQQSSWVNFFGDNIHINENKTFSILNDYIISANFSNDNKYIVIGTKQGLVRVWDIGTEEVKFEAVQKGKAIDCCTFSLKNTMILFACDNVILIYNFEENQYISQFMNTGRVTSLFVVPYSENKIISISNECATIWCWTQNDTHEGDICIYHIDNYVLDNRNNAHFICGTVTWDGIYLVLASSDHYITMWNIETKDKVKELIEHNGLVVCLDTFLNTESNSNYMYILLSGSDNKTVKQWHIEKLENQKCEARKLLLEFSSSWTNGSIPLIAAINTNSQVQIFSGHTLIVESEVFKQPRTLVFTPCGNYVVIGLNDGIVIIFDFKNKIYNYIMNLDGPINYIEYLSDSEAKSGYILVASAENTCLMLYKNNESIRLKTSENEEAITKNKIFKTIKCFSLLEIKRLISIEENGNIKLWCYKGIQDILVVNNSSSIVTMATISQRKDMIVLTLSNRCFRIYKLITTFDNITCTYIQGKLLDSIPSSCCFSSDGQLLAIGQESGNIVIWSVENKMQISILELHKSCARKLFFSPPALPGAPLILVSVGDQIAWWDITYVCLQATKNIRKNSRSRHSLRLSNSSQLMIDTTITTALMHDAWTDKRGCENKLELLSAIKLAGVHALNVSVSPNFNCFVTIDSSGLLYIMNVLQSPNI